MSGLLKCQARQLASPLRAAGPGKCQVAAFINALILAGLLSWLRRPRTRVFPCKLAGSWFSSASRLRGFVSRAEEVALCVFSPFDSVRWTKHGIGRNPWLAALLTRCDQRSAWRSAHARRS